MLRPVALVKIGISEERIASIIRATRIMLGLLVTATVSSADSCTLRMEAIRSSETSALTRVVRPHIPEYGILHIHRHENLRSYIA
jgi:hypothetical protein